MKKNITIEIISSLLILLFVYAGLSKLFNYSEFKNQLLASPLFQQYGSTIAIVLPLVELLTAAMLAINITRRTGLIISFLMMTLFTAYIIYMLFFASYLPCSCGGVLKNMTWNQHLVFNVFFLLLSLAGIFTGKKILLYNKRGSPPLNNGLSIL